MTEGGDQLGSPEQQADASPINGQIPPRDKRWKPGCKSPNPGGCPKGAKHASGRRAAIRELSIGWENDPHLDVEEKLGEGARQVGFDLIEAALAGDTDRVKALAVLIDQIEGRPQERVEHSAPTIKRVSISLESRPESAESP